MENYNELLFVIDLVSFIPSPYRLGRSGEWIGFIFGLGADYLVFVKRIDTSHLWPWVSILRGRETCPIHYLTSGGQ